MQSLPAKPIQGIFCFELAPNGSSAGWGDFRPAFRVTCTARKLVPYSAFGYSAGKRPLYKLDASVAQAPLGVEASN